MNVARGKTGLQACPACGCKNIEPDDHRCPRCGRRFDRAPLFVQPPLPLSLPQTDPGPVAAAAVATAPAPEWKQEVSERLDQFRRRRGLRPQPGLPFDDDDDDEAVPKPNRDEKVLPFEDFAAGKIEPLIVEAAKPAPKPAPKPIQTLPPLAETRIVLLGLEQPAAVPHAVAPVALRTIAGVLDLAITAVGVGLFFVIFHLLGGALHLQPKAAAAGFAGAVAALWAFYQLLYLFYGTETPGMQWSGLCVLDHDGRPPRSGQRLMRAAGAILSAAALGFGYLWAVLDEEGLTWHDRMSRTFVARDTRARSYFRSVG